MTANVELEAVVKRYTRGKITVNALASVSLSVADGEFLGIEGPSGSGKSTLLNICGLLDSPTSGSHRMSGINMKNLAERERCALRNKHIGFIFQRHGLLPTFTVYENIAYPLFLNGMTSRQIRPLVVDMLRRIGLQRRHNHLPRQLSGGECQRVGIARGLIKKPKLIIADEPSASVDHAQTLIALALLREFNVDGASFIIASHDNVVINSCDRKITLVDGCTVSTK